MSPTPNERSHKRRHSLEILHYAKRFQEKCTVHQFWIDLSMSKKISEISDVPDVDIAEAGCFKYILIEVRDLRAAYAQPKLVVRGDASCAYHGNKNEHYRSVNPILNSSFFYLADVLDIMEGQIDSKKLKLDCKGGGRIRVNPQKRTIEVYGYSMVNSFSIQF